MLIQFLNFVRPLKLDSFYVVLEVWEHEVKKDPDKVLKKILDFIEENK